jgi:hypothetical protein
MLKRKIIILFFISIICLFTYVHQASAVDITYLSNDPQGWGSFGLPTELLTIPFTINNETGITWTSFYIGFDLDLPSGDIPFFFDYNGPGTVDFFSGTDIYISDLNIVSGETWSHSITYDTGIVKAENDTFGIPNTLHFLL